MDFTKNHCFLLWLVFYFSSLEEKQGLYLFFFSFWSPWKHQKTKSFLIFSGGIERECWEEMGLKNSDSSQILSKKCHHKFTGDYIAGIYLFKVKSKHKSNVWNLFKVKNEDTRATSMTLFWYIYKLWTIFNYCSSVSIADFKRVNAGCIRSTTDLSKFLILYNTLRKLQQVSTFTKASMLKAPLNKKLQSFYSWWRHIMQALHRE